MLKVMPLPAFKDNYIWLLADPDNRHCIVIDPGDAQPVLDALAAQNLTLSAILITHHHHDHTGGITGLLQHFSVPVYGPAKENIKGVDHPVAENDLINIDPLNIQFRVLDIPGHTLGHIAYYGDKMLFCGDTLFAAGCGRLFEGTAAQMYHSLSKITALPDDTQIYCAHEYTEANLRFALAVEKDNQDIQRRAQEVAALREKNHPTLPSVLQLEKLTNPFLRCHLDSVIKSVRQHSDVRETTPVSIFQAVRKWKDTF